jgi:hypothetical protein
VNTDAMPFVFVIAIQFAQHGPSAPYSNSPMCTPRYIAAHPTNFPHQVIFRRLPSDLALCGDAGSKTASISATLQQLARHSLLHLIACVESDADERRILGALHELGLFDAGLKRHRVLFCSTPLGKVAMSRQLEPSLFIDGDATSILALEPHLASVVYVSAQGTDALAVARKSTRVVTSLAEVFDY